MGNWRGMMGPKGLAEPQVAYWSGVFSRLASTPEWNEDLDKNLLTPLFIGGVEARPFLDAEYKQISALMKDIGLAK